jgi:two-component system KDP operon response regulator KdpE
MLAVTTGMGSRPSKTPSRSEALVVVQERSVSQVLLLTLVAAGYRAYEALTPAEALERAETSGPDVILVDLALPDFGALELVRLVRERADMPVLLMSLKPWPGGARARALGEGADGFLQWPFSSQELVRQVRLARRRFSPSPLAQRVIVLGNVTVYVKKRLALRNGREVPLTNLECRLLLALLRRAGSTVTHQQLHEFVWNKGDPRLAWLRIYMFRLRHKLEQDPSNPRHLLTERGIGYRLRIG